MTVQSDLVSLCWLMEINEPNGSLLRWRLRLGNFHLQVVYKKGILNTHAEALLQLQNLGGQWPSIDEKI